MSNVPLSATARQNDVSAADLRREGKVPCVLYGNQKENVHMECVYNEIYKAYVHAGESTIVDLTVGNSTVPALFHELQFDPASDRLLHVDFYAVDMKKEIEANVPITFAGESPAVKELGGVLVTTHDHVTVKCLPVNLPHDISVSVVSITDFDSALYVSDLKAPEGVQILDDPEVMIATAQEPRRVEEEVPDEVVADGEGDGDQGTEDGGQRKEDKGEGDEGEKKKEGRDS
jgi:large subunit ribosomal protein L25